LKKEIFSLILLVVFSTSVFSVYLTEEEPNKIVYCKHDGIHIICSDSLSKCNSYYSDCKLISIYGVPDINTDPEDENNNSGDSNNSSDEDSSSDFLNSDDLSSDKPIYFNLNKNENKIDVIAENAFGLLEGAIIKVYKGNVLVKTVENPKASFILPKGDYRFEVERAGYAPSRKDVSIADAPINSVDEYQDKGIRQPLEPSRFSKDVIIQKDTLTDVADENSLDSITGQVASDLDKSSGSGFLSTIVYVLIGLLFVSAVAMLFFRFRT